VDRGEYENERTCYMYEMYMLRYEDGTMYGMYMLRYEDGTMYGMYMLRDEDGTMYEYVHAQV
jgi:hypothetical protein